MGYNKSAPLLSDEEAARRASEWFECNSKIAYWVCDRYLKFRKLKPAYNSDDLIGSAYIAACRCFKYYDETKAEFSTYFTFASKRWFDRWFASESESFYRCFANYMIQVSSCLSSKKLHPQPQDFANKAIVDGWLLERNFYQDRQHRFYRIPVPGDDIAQAMFELFEYDDLKLFNSIIEYLSEREKSLIKMVYQDDMTYREIAAKLEVTYQRVQQIHARCLDRIKIKINALLKVAELFNIYPKLIKDEVINDSIWENHEQAI